MTTERVLVLILDGIGFDPERESAILDAVWNGLSADAQDTLDLIIAGSPPLTNLVTEGHTAEARRLLMTPTLVTVASGLIAAKLLPADALAEVRDARERVAERRVAGRGLVDLIHAGRARVAYEHHYIPWCLKTPRLWALRENFPTFVTHPAGIFAGYPDLGPGKAPIMGNSDTGHQQIMNLCVARQLSTQITALIESGKLAKNEELAGALRAAAEDPDGQIVARFMASGEFGDDGFVHSCMLHFEGFLKLYFKQLDLPKEKLRLQLILDGRDSPPDSSVKGEEIDGVARYDFLGKVRRHLAEKYDAESCIAWIMGRQFMDRDYKGAMIRRDYELLTGNAGRRVADLDAAIAMIRADHAAGKTDPMIEPIVVGDPRPVDGHTVFFNLQFRSDRQEPITAALLGLRDFIELQATEKKKLDTWDGFTWLRDDLGGLRMFTLAEYNSKFTGPRCTPIATDAPHAHNLLWLMHEHAPDFRFFFLGEGVKEKHVGMFSRGRRSQPLAPNEDRFIVPSYGREDGVENDNDFWKKPMMRHPEIGDKLVERLGARQGGRRDDLILVNVPGADMVGHLVLQHFDAGIETLQSLEDFVAKVMPVAEENGWNVIVTADHGNLEHYGADHGNNDVLTTVVVREERRDDFAPTLEPGETARLFDVAHTARALMSAGAALDGHIPPYPDDIADDKRRLVGKALMVMRSE